MDKKYTIFLIVISSFLYAFPFIEPLYLWFLIFLFPIPLIVISETLEKKPFFYLFLWCFISGLIEVAGINTGLANLTKGHLWIRIIIPTLLVTFQAAMCGIIFFLSTQLIKSRMRNQIKQALYGLTLFIFFCYIEYGALWFTGTIEGYSLGNPILPLMHIPFFRMLVMHLDPTIVLALIIGLGTTIGISLSYAMTKKVYYSNFFLITLIIIIVGTASMMIPPRNNPPPLWINQIVALPYFFYVPYNMTFLMTTVREELRKIIYKYPQVSLIVMPESSLYCSFLHMPELTNLLSEKNISKAINLVAGSFSFNNNQYHNTLYWIKNGVLQLCYYKRHTMFLTERIPFWLHKTYIEEIFFSQSPTIAQSTNKKQLLAFNDEIKLVPYICSELFFNHYPDDDLQEYPILAIANDRHFLPYTGDIMVRYAQKIAITWKRAIVYVSFLKHCYIDTYGEIFPLLT